MWSKRVFCWESSVALVFVCLLMAAFSGCGTSSRSEITVGAALPLTGVVSYYGQDARHGIDLGVEEINQAGGIDGKKLSVIYQDTHGKGDEAVAAIRSLIDLSGVPAVIGGGTSTETLAMAPIAEQSKCVLISPVSSASKISEAGDYIFRTVPSDRAQAADLASWVIEEGDDSIALIYVNQSWGTGLKEDFQRAFEHLGGTILSLEATEQGELDFRTQLVRMRSTNPKAYVAIIYANEGGLLLRQARELGIGGRFFGADPWTKHQFIEAAGEAGNGVLFTTPALFNGKEFEEFAANYREKYKSEPGIYEAHGYDTIKLLALAIKSGGYSSEGIRAGLSSISGYMGATGETTFDQNGDVPTKGFARMEWRDGDLVRIK